MRQAAALGILLFTSACGAAEPPRHTPVGPPPGTLVNRVVAVVDKDVITYSELLLEARVALAYKEGEVVASGELDEAFLDTFLTYLIDQYLIAMQVRRLGGVDIQEAEAERELRRFAQRFRSSDAFRAFLRRFDIPEERLKTILVRMLKNDRYVAERMRIRLVENAGRDERRYQEALARWLEELRTSAEIRLLGPSGELELWSPERRPAG